MKHWSARWAAAVLLAVALCGPPVSADAAAKTAGGDGRLEIHIEPSRPVLGHPLHLRLRAVGAPQPLAGISLAPLRSNFHVQDVAAGHDRVRRGGRRLAVDTLDITLYPLHSGRLSVPALHLGTWASRPETIQVAAVGSPGSVIRVRSGIGQTAPWVRQEILVYIDVYDDGGGVLAELPAWHPPGAFVRRLDTQRRRVREDGVAYNVTRLAWAVMPLRAGPLDLEFPLLRVRSRERFGKRLLYPVSAIHLQARPLPSYLPPRVPVGQVTIRSDPPAGRLWPGRTYLWHLDVSGRGLDAAGLRALLAPQLRRMLEPGASGSDGVKLYQPLYERRPVDKGEPLRQTFRVSIPLSIGDPGTHRLASLHVPFVEVRTGRLETARAAGPVLRVTSPVWFYTRWALALAAALAVVGWIGVRLCAALRWRAARRTLIRRLAAAQTPREIAAALLSWDPARGTSARRRVPPRTPPRTLEQWHAQIFELPDRAWASDLADELTRALSRLQRACYARDESPPVPALREEIGAIARRL
ncbi:MAG TPA: hypothetical protein VKA50_06610 [Gammaproteobacteria bacterium]|nr:hypothetical protein [Gammaproteobacteria bacterium]